MLFISAFAKNCFGLITFDQVDSISVTWREFEFMSLAHHLDFVGHPMSTQLFGVKEIDIALISANMEIPDAVQLLTNAMHWLVCWNKLIRLIIEGVNIRY